MCAQLLSQSCPTPCDPVDWSPPGPYVHAVLQARILEWVAVPSSSGSSRPGDPTCISCISCSHHPGRFENIVIIPETPISHGSHSPPPAPALGCRSSTFCFCRFAVLSSSHKWSCAICGPCAWLLSLTTMLPRLMHVIADIRISFFYYC